MRQYENSKTPLKVFGALYDFNYLSYDITARKVLNVDGNGDARGNEDDDAALGVNDKDENEYSEGDDDEKHDEDADNDEELLRENTDNYDNTEDENSDDDFQTEELNKKRKEIRYKKLSPPKCRKV